MIQPLKKITLYSGILSLVLGIVSSCKPTPNDLESAKFLIDSIQSQTIHDSRVEIFTIKATYAGDGILLKGKTTHPEAVEKLLTQLRKQEVVFLDSIVRLPDPALGGKIWGLVSVSVKNLRSNPAQSAELATQALMGTPVKILQEENGYFLVQTPDDYISWTEKAKLIPMDQSGLDAWKRSLRLIFLGENGTIRETPDPKSLPVSDIVLGGIVQTDDTRKATGNYVPVVLPDGRKGYLDKTFCRDFRTWSQDVVPDPAAMINTAKDYMGTPYLWGGTSGKGFDCSGFTKILYMTGGLILSRDASQQAEQGNEVSMENGGSQLQPGDLLFVGRKATAQAGERIGHVMMYIGNTEFIHCSGMGLVGVNSLDSTRTNRMPSSYVIVHARRMIGSTTPIATFKSHPWYN